MAGDGEDGRMYVLLFFITVFMRLAFIRRRSRFQQRLQLLMIRSKMRRTEACSYQLRRKFRKKKVAWVLERPQFWFEHMVLSHYENNIWREHFRISRQRLPHTSRFFVGRQKICSSATKNRLVCGGLLPFGLFVSFHGRN